MHLQVPHDMQIITFRTVVSLTSGIVQHPGPSQQAIHQYHCLLCSVITQSQTYVWYMTHVPMSSEASLGTVRTQIVV